MGRRKMSIWRKLYITYERNPVFYLSVLLVILGILTAIMIPLENGKLKKAEAESVKKKESVKKESSSTSTTTGQVQTEEPVLVPADPVAVFSNAVFIGDSRMKGFYTYSDISNYCNNFAVYEGLDVGDFDSEKFAGESGDQTVFEYLTDKNYDKVFLMQGINELGWPSVDSFISQYQEDIEQIQTLCPNAKIYLMQIINVTKEKSDSDSYINRTRIRQYNRAIKALCDGENIIWINLNKELSEDGYLISEATTDGVHLTSQYAQVMFEEILQFFTEHPDGMDIKEEETTTEASSTEEETTTTGSVADQMVTEGEAIE